MILLLGRAINGRITEFAVTHNFMITPGAYSPGGNVDSGTPFYEGFSINGQPEISVTILESVFLNILLEYWLTSQQGIYINLHRLLFGVPLELLIKEFGAELGAKCYETMEWHHSQKEQRRILKASLSR